jgi:hypothetical protein
MFFLKKINRLQAFGMHLAVSVSIAVMCFSFVFLVWYPGFLAYASNVTNIFLLLLLVDVVIGPVITLVIYNPLKKELSRDLIIVGIIQFSALLYGLHAVFIARPVYIVFNVGQFDLTYANDISEKNLKLASGGAYHSLPVWGPQLVSVVLPSDPKLLSAIIISSVMGTDQIQAQPQYFAEYTKQEIEIQKSLKPLETLHTFNKERTLAVTALIKKYQSQRIDVGYLPLLAKNHNLTLLIDRSSAEILETVDLKPLP